jgi:hypothetical protein
MSDYRTVTEREIYNREFLALHKTCMQMACAEATEIANEYDVPIECFDISALTYQHFRLWSDRREFIKTKQAELQATLKVAK